MSLTEQQPKSDLRAIWKSYFVGRTGAAWSQVLELPPPFAIPPPTDRQMEVIQKFERSSIPFTAHYIPPANGGGWVLFNTSLHPHYADGQQMVRSDEVVGTIIAELAREGKITQLANIPEGSRFGITPHHIVTEVLPRVGSVLGVSENVVRLPTLADRAIQLKLEAKSMNFHQFGYDEESTAELLINLGETHPTKFSVLNRARLIQLQQGRNLSDTVDVVGPFDADKQIGFNFVVDLSKVA